MRKTIRTSTHSLGQALLGRPEAPVRALTLGRFTITWDGKPGDFTETISFEEFMSDSKPVSDTESGRVHG